MPTSFLDLPREIRDYIYNHALTSPTGYVVAQISKNMDPSSNPLSCRQSSVSKKVTKPPSPPRKPQAVRLRIFPYNPSSYSDFARKREQPLATALPLVSRLLYLETKDILWANNTLVLPRVSNARQILKHMGQKPSRQIQRVILQVRFDLKYSNAGLTHILNSALRSLHSRCRCGKLDWLRVELEIPDKFTVRNDYGRTIMAFAHSSDDTRDLAWECSREVGFLNLSRLADVDLVAMFEERPSLDRWHESRMAKGWAWEKTRLDRTWISRNGDRNEYGPAHLDFNDIFHKQKSD
jgi:hypothetical protein